MDGVRVSETEGGSLGSFGPNTRSELSSSPPSLPSPFGSPVSTRPVRSRSPCFDPFLSERRSPRPDGRDLELRSRPVFKFGTMPLDSSRSVLELVVIWSLLEGKGSGVEVVSKRGSGVDGGDWLGLGVDGVGRVWV